MSQIQFKTVWDKKAPLQRQKTKNKKRTAVYFYSTQLFFFFFLENLPSKISLLYDIVI